MEEAYSGVYGKEPARFCAAQFFARNELIEHP